jgi:DNA invertase Pin-like site-specific DNA recombinase
MAITPKARRKALAYLRTSSATNTDGDSAERQRVAIRAYAEHASIEVIQEFYDAAVSGADPIETRPGFADMLARIDGNGVRLVLVEDPSRFARSMLAQELGVLLMQRRKVRVVTASGEDLTASDDSSRVMMRQVAGAFAQYEKDRLVGKLRGARERIRAETGRCEGRKPTLIGDALAMARRLRRKNPRTGERRSLHDIAVALAAAGHVNPVTTKPYSAEAIRLALAAPREASPPTNPETAV